MNVLFIANFELKETEGIYKKVLAQANGLKNANGSGWLITKKNKGSLIRNLQNNYTFAIGGDVLDNAKRLIEENNIKLVYVRHMMPSPKLIKLLGWIKKNRIKLFYEIPNYPYYAEQYRTAVKKYRAVGKLVIHTLFWPFIYIKVDKLVVIKGNSKVRMYKKMVEITNGVRVDNIVEKYYEECPIEKISMVAVGTLYSYHGYDRVLKGLQIYNASNPKIPIEFHVVGCSPTIDELKKESIKMGLTNVIFHGVKTTEELNEMYNSFDIGMSSVALSRRNSDIDTTIKIIEYYCRGVVAVTSGMSPMDNIDPEITIHVPDDEMPIDIKYIVDSYMKISLEHKCCIAKKAKKIFSWDRIMQNLCE